MIYKSIVTVASRDSKTWRPTILTRPYPNTMSTRLVILDRDGTINADR